MRRPRDLVLRPILGLRLGRGDAGRGGQALLLAPRSPGLVFGHRESLVDLIHGHELLLPSASARSSDGRHVDLVAQLGRGACLPESLIVTETVLDADDDPVIALVS